MEDEDKKCSECLGDIGQYGFFECDACEVTFYKACAGLTSSELKCMPLQKRVLRFFCKHCQNFIKKIPKLIYMVEEMRNEIKELREVIIIKSNGAQDKVKTMEVLKQDLKEIKETIGRKEEVKYSEIVNTKSEVMLIKPKDETQRSIITRQTVQETIDPTKLGVGVFKLKHVRKGGIALCCNNNVPVDNVCKKLEKELGKDYQIQKVAKQNPRIKIKNVAKKDLEDVNLFIEKMVIQNTIQTEIEERKIKTIHKYTPKTYNNQNNINVIVELDSKTYDIIKNKEVSYIG